MQWTRTRALLYRTEVPLIAWSTPGRFLGGESGFRRGSDDLGERGTLTSVYQESGGSPVQLPLAELGWDLGEGWGVRYLVGAYFEIRQPGRI